MKERTIRRQCRRLLRDLDIKPPLDVPEFCRRLAAHRGRPINLVPYPIETPGPFGIWFMTDSADVIFYQQETTRSHQDHIILHEMGHIIAGHSGELFGEPSDPAGPGEPDGGLPRLRRRTSYDSEHEREAELIATIILEWATLLGGGRSGDPAPPPESVALERMGQALAHRTGWL